MGTLRTRVDVFIERMKCEDVNLHGFLLSVNGVPKAEAYYPPFKSSEAHRMYSISKTATGIAIGLLINEGKLKLDDRICNYFTDWLPNEPSKFLTETTICDLLRMTSCHGYTYNEQDENWAKAVFNTPPTHMPGTVFFYENGGPQILSELVARITGQSVLDFLEEKVFSPLKMNDPKYWLTDPSGHCQGAAGLGLSLRDLHKLTQCILDGGRGVIPRGFCKQMVEKQTETCLQVNEEERYGYGYLCWRTRAGWALYGWGGQLSIACPEKHTVFSTIADTSLDPVGVQRIYNAFFEEIYPYTEKEDMTFVSLKPEPQKLENHPEFIFEDENEYVFADNSMGIKTGRLLKNVLCFENAHGCAEIRFIPGESFRTFFPGNEKVPAVVQAAYIGVKKLRLRVNAIGCSPCGFDMLLVFKNNCMTIISRRSLQDHVTDGYEGTATGYRNETVHASVS